MKNCSYGVKKGEVFGLLGPNGSGKSTNFNVITSLIPKSSGKVSLLGTDISKGNKDVY